MAVFDQLVVGLITNQCNRDLNESRVREMKGASYGAKRKDKQEKNFIYRGYNLNSLAHSSLCSLNRRAVPFQGLLDFTGKGRFARDHIVNEFFLRIDLHARVILFLIAEGRDGLPIIVTGKDANLISEGFEFR